MISCKRLRAALSYDPETGIFRWRQRHGCRAGGAIAGTKDAKRGYVQICIDGHQYRAHRLAWLYVHGKWPTPEADHRNGVGSDNRIENLRVATRSQNSCNGAAHKDGRSGIKGVSWNVGREKWVAQIRATGQTHFLGRFAKMKDACAAYRAAAARLHGEFARVR